MRGLFTTMPDSKPAIATSRALEIVMSRCRLNDRTADDLRRLLAAERARGNAERTGGS